MSGETEAPTGPDFAAGVALTEIPDGGLLAGHVGGEPAILFRSGAEVLAIGAKCTHYGGPLAEGLVVGDTVRCPWHHACFSLRTGENLRPPALDPVNAWRVVREGDRVRVGEKLAAPAQPAAPKGAPDSIVIVGAGAAGLVAAKTLRREGYAGRLILVGADKSDPVDRPNLSKDYLAGKAPEEWIPLRPPEFYAESGIELTTGVEAQSLDTGTKRVGLSDGRTLSYGACSSRREPSPSGWTFPARGCPTCTRCARSPTAAPSSISRRRRSAPS